MVTDESHAYPGIVLLLYPTLIRSHGMAAIPIDTGFRVTKRFGSDDRTAFRNRGHYA